MKNKLKVGDIYSTEWIPTYKDIENFANLSGDFNPIHIDISEAKKIGKKNIIVHGNLTCSYLSKIIGMDFPGKGSLILEQNISFPNPVYPNDLVKIQFLIKAINDTLKILNIKINGFKEIKESKLGKKVVLRGNILCRI